MIRTLCNKPLIFFKEHLKISDFIIILVLIIIFVHCSVQILTCFKN
jgi:hypothetical protein